MRYGTLTLLYLVSTVFIFNITRLTENYISFASFIIFSIILNFLTRLSNNSVKILNVIALLFGTSLEFYCILNIFRYSSDNNATMAGSLVFAIVILLVTFLAASLRGIYTLLKASNIIFFLPLIPLLVLPVFFLNGTAYFSAVFKSPTYTQILPSILNGIKSSVLLFSDICIINIMQKKEKCYNIGSSTLFYFIALILIIITNVMYRLIFGVNTASSLISPIFSVLSVIARLGLDEIVSFIFSVCLLFRQSCRNTCILSLFGTKKIKSPSYAAAVFLSTIFALFGVLLIYKKIVNINLFLNITVSLYSLAYLLVPIFDRFFLQKKETNLASTEFAKRK